MNKYNKWISSDNLSEAEKLQIKNLSEQDKSEAFDLNLEFGTAGIRTHMGLGPSLLNKHTIKMITFAWIKSLENNWANELKQPLLITHDTRNNGVEFALEVAGVISGMGYKAKIVYRNMPVPTPLSSYTIRKFNLGGGACITASHNPPIYSGYKVFDAMGRHLMPERTDAIQNELKKIDINTKIPSNQDNVSFLTETLEEEFVEDMLKATPVKKGNKNIKIVFSPLHGASYKLAPMALRQSGFEVITEPKQSVPDGNFTYVKDPNPENPEAFELMMELGNEINADVLLTSDPDGDRVGIAVKKDGKYQVIGGHDIASLLTHYLLKLYKEQGNDMSKESIIKTVVTTSLVDDIAKSFGVKVINTLTGFKYIGHAASQMDRKPLLATEESYGASSCLNLSYDKDSVQILPILADIVDHYKKEGENLFDVIESIYRKYSGQYVLNYNDKEKLVGPFAKEDLSKLINNISKLDNVMDIKISNIEDYRKGVEKIPKANLVKVFLEDKKSWFAVRPSGTEPLIRKYYCIFADDKKSAEAVVEKIEKTINKLKDKNE